jgi:hypothetical protein
VIRFYRYFPVHSAISGHTFLITGTGIMKSAGILAGTYRRKPEIGMNNKAPDMKHVKILIPALVMLLCMLAAGCTSSVPDTPATQVPTSLPTTVTSPSPLPVTTPVNEPIQVLPRERQVTVVLTKDRPTSEIHLQYQGGPGEMFVNSILMRVYSSEGVFTEYRMSNGKKPLVGDEIVVMGTRGYDRCEVFVISAGTRYKVLDAAAVGGGYY